MRHAALNSIVYSECQTLPHKSTHVSEDDNTCSHYRWWIKFRHNTKRSRTMEHKCRSDPEIDSFRIRIVTVTVYAHN